MPDFIIAERSFEDEVIIRALNLTGFDKPTG